MTLPIGTVLYGYCGGIFGRDSYDDKRVEAVGTDWIVCRDSAGDPVFAGRQRHPPRPRGIHRAARLNHPAYSSTLRALTTPPRKDAPLTTHEALQVRQLIDTYTAMTDEQQAVVIDELTRRRVEQRLRARRKRGLVPVQRIQEIPPA